VVCGEPGGACIIIGLFFSRNRRVGFFSGRRAAAARRRSIFLDDFNSLWFLAPFCLKEKPMAFGMLVCALV
jgi:hypothetical protein